MNIIDKFFKRQPKLTQEQAVLVQLNEGLRILESHMVAIARLQFIKPETLVREAGNTKANTEYLQNLIKVRNNDAK